MADELKSVEGSIFEEMVSVLKDKGQKVAAFAKPEATKIAQTIVSIKESKAAGLLTENEARLLLDMQKGASRAVLACCEGMAVVAAEQAINAALGKIRDLVNRALGFELIPFV